MNISELRKKHDTENMFSVLEAFPRQVDEAAKLSASIPKDVVNRIENIVITGIGASGIIGQLAKTYCEDKLSIPVISVKDYDIPAFAGKNTLAFVISYSGDTEEPLATFSALKERGAYIIGLSRAGQLEQMTENHIKLPDSPMPRTAVGYLLIPVLVTLQKAGLLNNIDKEIKECEDVLKKLSKELTSENNIALDIAKCLHNKTPIIYAHERFAQIAYRMVTQINENAKHFAFYQTIPDQNHNEINAVDANAREDMQAVFIRDIEHSRNKKRIEYLEALMKKRKIPVKEIHAKGNHLLSRMLSAIYIGDFTSYYLALLYGINPMPVAAIDKLKEFMVEK